MSLNKNKDVYIVTIIAMQKNKNLNNFFALKLGKM